MCSVEHLARHLQAHDNGRYFHEPHHFAHLRRRYSDFDPEEHAAKHARLHAESARREAIQALEEAMSNSWAVVGKDAREQK